MTGLRYNWLWGSFWLAKVYGCPCYFNAIVFHKKKKRNCICSVDVPKFLRKKINSNCYLMYTAAKTLFVCILHCVWNISYLETEIKCDLTLRFNTGFVNIVTLDTTYKLCQSCFARKCIKQVSQSIYFRWWYIWFVTRLFLCCFTIPKEKGISHKML